MPSIRFDKGEYKAGETATITYVDAPRNSLAAIRRSGLIIHRKALVSGGSGSFEYSIPATLGTYKAELWLEGRIIAHDTMEVVTGAAPPAEKGYLTVTSSPTGATVTVNGVSCGTTPVTACALSTGSKTVTITKAGYNTVTRSVTIRAGETEDLGTITLTPTAAPPAEGETRELELGDYEVTWTLSGRDTLNAEITVTDTGVTCLSVTGGACYSATPPGVTISTFTVTGHLKSAVAPPVGCVMTIETNKEVYSVGEAITISGKHTDNGNPVSYATVAFTAWLNGSKVAPVRQGYPEGYIGETKTDAGGNYRFLFTPDKAGAWDFEAWNDCTSERKRVTVSAVVPPPVGIGSWIDESGVTNLTKDHAVYVFYVSAGAVSAADGKYAKLSPKPSRLDPSLASKDNAIGIFYYSQGAMAAGNGKTGCNY